MTENNKWNKLDEELNAPKDEIIIIVDRSGSMGNIWKDAVGGLNSFIAENKEAGEAFVTLVAFDSHVEYPRGEGKLELLEFEDVSLREFGPRGATAMNDAIGMTLNGFVPNHPDAKVAVVIITDGGENSSREYTDRDAIKKLIEEKQDGGWQFTFLAANMDAFEEGSSFGISLDTTQTFEATGVGVRSAYMFASANTVAYRTGSSRAQSQQDRLVDLEVLKEQAELDSHNQ